MRSPRYLNVPTFWGSGETRSVRLTVRLFWWSFIDIWTYPRFERPVRFSGEILCDISRWVSQRYLNVPTFWASGEIFQWDSLRYFSVSLAQISERTHVLSVRRDFRVRFTMILLGESQCVESRWDFSVSVFQDFPGDSFVVILGESFSIFHCECFVNLFLWVHVEFDRSVFC